MPAKRPQPGSTPTKSALKPFNSPATASYQPLTPLTHPTLAHKLLEKPQTTPWIPNRSVTWQSLSVWHMPKSLTHFGQILASKLLPEVTSWSHLLKYLFQVQAPSQCPKSLPQVNAPSHCPKSLPQVTAPSHPQKVTPFKYLNQVTYPSYPHLVTPI